MVNYNSPAQVDLFKENFNDAVKGISMVKQVMKQDLFLVQKSTSAEEHFYRETTGDLAGLSQIPKGADFVADQLSWEKFTVRPQKFGTESTINWEDTMVNAIDIMARTTMRVANRVARLVDTQAWNVASDNQSTTNLNSFTIAGGATWNNATRSARIPHEDIARAVRTITDSNLQAYEPDTLVLSPLDFVYVITNDYVMSSYDASSPALMNTGRMGTLFGLNIIKHPVVTADYALVCEAKKIATWKEVAGMSSEVIRDPGRRITLRAWEYGNGALTDPKAGSLIVNTQT